MLHELSKWLADNSLAVEAFAAAATVLLTAVLVVTTIIYARTTGKILEESRKAREAAEKQAEASQENLRLLKEQYESQLGIGPQIVREAILDTKRLIVYWIEQSLRIAHPPYGNPDPAPVATSSLLSAMDHARKISEECADLILAAHADLRNAKSELEKAYKTARQQTFPPANPASATKYLQQADGSLNKALAIAKARIG